MNFLNRFLNKRPGNGRVTPKQSRQAEPLTPAQVQELHQQLYPEAHARQVAAQWKSEPPLRDPRDNLVAFARPSLFDQGPPVNPQHNSLLFTKLPPELRSLCWSYAIGSQKIYLSEKYERLRQAPKMLDLGWWPKTDLLDVPLLCRAAYFESIDFLYSQNTFCIGFGSEGNKRILTLLYKMLPARHIASLRHIEVAFHLVQGLTFYDDSRHGAWDLSVMIPPDSDYIWQRAFEELVKLDRLQTLVITVWASGSIRKRFPDEEKYLLRPLLELKHLQSCIVRLSWKQPDDALWADAPFTVIRNFEDRPRFELSVPLLPVPELS